MSTDATSNNRSSRKAIIQLILSIFIIILTACASNDETSAIANSTTMDAPMAEEAEAMSDDFLANQVSNDSAELDSDGVTGGNGADSQIPRTSSNRSNNRLIIKNAELHLTVEDTDTAIDRAQGIVVDFGGYIVSNRTWLSSDYKYATLNIGVPSENFEDMLRRLKGISLSVTNETISGQDVSDQYVDLQSRLRNLEATADRIRELLQAATDVDKALEISDRLSEVESEIEQIKGRMNYLQERAAFSTITLEIAPDIPPFEPASRPRWNPGETFQEALEAAIELSQGLIDALIWLVVVGIPCLIPIGILFWIGRLLYRRFRANQAATSSEKTTSTSEEAA